MHIAIITPLFPPDIGDPAPYVKELATRLSGTHDVSVLLYGHLPEAAGTAQLVTVDKRSFILWRLLRMVRAVYRATKTADVLYVQNGPSVELPTLLVSYVSNTPIVFGLTDPLNLQTLADDTLHRAIHRRLKRRAAHSIDLARHDELSRLTRPEQLPFPEENDPASWDAYAAAWQEHLASLKETFTTV